MNLAQYDGKAVKVTMTTGEVFMGVCEVSSAEFNECEYGEKEDSLDLGGFNGWKIYASQIASVELLKNE